MSSCGNPSAEADPIMPRRQKYDKSKACIKCKSNPGNIVIRHAVYCKECFYPLISIRFRRALEGFINPGPEMHRHKGLKAAGNLLIGYSGGLGSSVLMDLVHNTYLTKRVQHELDQNPNRGCPWPKVIIAHVDISGAFLHEQKSKDISNDIKEVVDSYSRSEYLDLRLEDAFDEAWWQKRGGYGSSKLGVEIVNEELYLKCLSDTSGSPTSALHVYLSSFPTQTAKSNAIQLLIRLLLLYSALSTGSSHLLLGTNLTSLSISLISSVSQGAGYTIREESQEEWTSGQINVRIIRPLREVGIKECAFYSWWSRLRFVGKSRYSGGRQDITSLTRDFIMGLEKDYPSTVSTIARTCGKLTTRENTSSRCILCERPAQPGVQEWKNKISIRSYDKGHKASLDAQSQVTTFDTIDSFLCYACHTSWTSKSIRGNVDSPKQVLLPVWMGSYQSLQAAGVKSKVNTGAQDVQNIIGEFLIDQDS